MTHARWEAKGVRLFGENRMQWKFVCPACGHVQSVQDYKDAGAPSNVIAFSCIGRFLQGTPRDAFKKGSGPCNYAGGGLLRLNPVDVDGNKYFDFAALDRAEGV